MRWGKRITPLIIAISVTNENTHWSIELDPQKGMGSYFVQSR